MGMSQKQIVVGQKGGLLLANDIKTANVFKLMVLSNEIVSRYGLSSEYLKDGKDFENRLDRAIKGLETEIGLKHAQC